MLIQIGQLWHSRCGRVKIEITRVEQCEQWGQRIYFVGTDVDGTIEEAQQGGFFSETTFFNNFIFQDRDKVVVQAASLVNDDGVTRFVFKHDLAWVIESERPGYDHVEVKKTAYGITALPLQLCFSPHLATRLHKIDGVYFHSPAFSDMIIPFKVAEKIHF